MARTMLAPILETGLTTGGAGTAVFVRIRGSDGALWNTSGTPAFETFNASNIANYAITATEIGSTGIYMGTDPDGTTDGKYLLVVKAGSSLAVSDLVSGLRYEDNAELDAAGVRTAVGLASANLDTQLDALPTAAENATAVLTTAMTESYAADGVAPTLAQSVFLVMQSLHEFSISGTTRTVKKLDGSTTAAVFTLNDATSPTSTTRSS